ncbi:MAG: methyltransferase domain-containing protein [Planctomycetota bacterium]|jgi:2-polyprenyl-3-methyl-5-hydroxy-6-metoxy-1,4-benzoquinol methylase
MSILTGRRLTPERMDDPDIGRDELVKALRFLRRFNAGFGSARTAVRIVRRLTAGWPDDRPIRLLDVGTGSADIPLVLADWARRAGRTVRIVAVDAHPLTVELARAHVRGHDEITVVEADARRLTDRYEPGAFDIAHAALFLHHLSDLEVMTVLRVMDRLATTGVIWSDLLRSNAARLGVRLLTIGAGPVARHDGAVSVEAGFTKREALDLANRVGLQSVTFRTHLAHRFSLTSAPAG